MKKMELLKIKNDLFWASKKHHGFDELFRTTDFFNKFTEFLTTDIGIEWLESEEGRLYNEWQSR